MGFEFKIAEKIEKLKIDGMTCREIANKLGFYSKFEVGEIQKVLDSMVSSKKLKTKSNKYFKIKEIKKIKNIPVIMLSARGEEYDKLFGFEIGADDYVTKPFNPLELVARVKSQLRRYTKLGNAAEESQKIYQTGGLVMNDDLKEVTVDGEPVKLTPIEYNILLLLVKNQGKVFSINQIYESIWNEDAIGADNTVAVHIRHIREKIEINAKEPRYLKVVWGIGYKVEKL